MCKQLISLIRRVVALNQMEKESIIICYRHAAIQFDGELKSINLSASASRASRLMNYNNLLCAKQFKCDFSI